MKPFSKPYLPVPAQIALLKGRGLTITDDARATAALERIGYYRLSGYWYPLRTSTITNPGEESGCTLLSIMDVVGQQVNS